MWVRAGRGSADGRDGPLRWAFETDDTAFWRRLFQKSVIAGRESGPWTAGRDGLLGWTFETNGTASLRRLFQKSVRAGRGGGPWTDVRDGPLGWTFETNGTASLRRLFQKSVRAGRGGGPWTDVRDGPLGRTFETNGTASLRRLFQKSVRAGRGGGPWTDGRGRTSVTGRWDGLLKQMARIPHADCFRSLSERAVMAFTGCWDWLLRNKRHGFLLPIVSEVRQQSGPWGRVVDSRSWRAAGMNFSELLVSLFHFNQISVSQSFLQQLRILHRDQQNVVQFFFYIIS